MSLRRLHLIAVPLFLVGTVACSSSVSRSASTASTSTTSTVAGSVPVTDAGGAGGTTTTTVAGATTTVSVAPPTTKAPTGPYVASMSVARPNCSGGASTIQIAVSWNVKNADSVNISYDGEYQLWKADLPLVGSYSVNFACDGQPHTYYVQVIKGGKQVAEKIKTVNP